MTGQYKYRKGHTGNPLTLWIPSASVQLHETGDSQSAYFGNAAAATRTMLISFLKEQSRVPMKGMVEGERQTDRQRQRQNHREIETETDRQRQTGRQRETEKQRETETEIHK